MDLLSEILNQANWKNDLLVKRTLTRNWGYRFPCERSGGFHIVTMGSCYARTDKELIMLERGDFLFIVKGVHHDLVSSPKEKVVPLLDINKVKNSKTINHTNLEEAKKISLKKNHSTVDKQIANTSIVSIRYEVPDGSIHPFFLELPSIIHVKSKEISFGHPIHTTIEMISQEMESSVGSDLILQRLTDILLYYTIRRWLESNPYPESGWVGVFRDEKVIAVLELIHKDSTYNWTIESLANSVGLSRASLAFRFKKSLGITINDYIVKLKLEKGKNLIHDSEISLEEVSRRVGYSSAFAFSKAYKRIYGQAPRKRKVS